LREVLATGEPQKLRFNLSAAYARTFEVQATPLAMPSGRGAIAILHDITDLERLEQVRKDFVANVSHELRTPLAGVIGYAETLLDGALKDEANNRKFVEIIRTNAVRLNSIAADLLVLSDLESGSDPEPDVISVQGVLDAAVVTVQAEARERDVTLICENIENVFVSGSRLRLEQAILNLMANAIKFNRPGGEVRVRAGVNESHQVEIVIADTGVGIPSQDLPRIFERFYRIDKARSREVGGTGLGLSIVKHVVERMNGAIEVESQLGRGSVFTLRLPAV
jgi:two-component system phosphate regulon sensor histidine kinase PhoR